MRDYCVECSEKLDKDVLTEVTFYEETGNGYVIEYTCPICGETDSYYEF